MEVKASFASARSQWRRSVNRLWESSNTRASLLMPLSLPTDGLTSTPLLLSALMPSSTGTVLRIKSIYFKSMSTALSPPATVALQRQFISPFLREKGHWLENFVVGSVLFLILPFLMPLSLFCFLASLLLKTHLRGRMLAQTESAVCLCRGQQWSTAVGFSDVAFILFNHLIVEQGGKWSVLPPCI